MARSSHPGTPRQVPDATPCPVTGMFREYCCRPVGTEGAQMSSQSATISLPLLSARAVIGSDSRSPPDVRTRLVSNGDADLSDIDRRQNPGPDVQNCEEASVRNRLSPRENEVLHWLAHGKSGFEIGIILGISPCTVRIHIQSAKRKMNAVNIPHFIYLACALGILKS
jgi:DNA-binding CsgD family transcriptional regulator